GVPWLLRGRSTARPISEADACTALSVLGSNAVPALVEAADQPLPLVRFLASRSLASLNLDVLNHNQAALFAFVRLVKDPVARVRGWAVIGLSRIGGFREEVVAGLTAALMSGEEGPSEAAAVRMQAAYFLGRVGRAAGPAVPELKGLLTSSDPP